MLNLEAIDGDLRCPQAHDFCWTNIPSNYYDWVENVHKHYPAMIAEIRRLRAEVEDLQDAVSDRGQQIDQMEAGVPFGATRRQSPPSK